MKVDYKIGGVELTEKEVAEIYESEKYIVSYSGVYQVKYSNAQQRYTNFHVIREKGIVSRGRFHVLTGKQINDILGKEILI